jgi:peptidoglycan hydrolase CwlO-like protein
MTTYDSQHFINESIVQESRLRVGTIEYEMKQLQSQLQNAYKRIDELLEENTNLKQQLSIK